MCSDHCHHQQVHCLHRFRNSRGGMQTITLMKISTSAMTYLLLVDEENDNNNDIVLSSPVLVGRSDDGYDNKLIYLNPLTLTLLQNVNDDNNIASKIINNMQCDDGTNK